MKTPTFNDFEYLVGEIKNDLKIGNYQIEIEFWKNEMIQDIHHFFSIR